MTTQRLSKVLAAAGIAARRKCEEIIAVGRVQVNGDLVTLPQTQVDPTRDRITVDNQPIAEEEKVYFLLNKPVGYLCTQDPRVKKRVVDLLSPLNARLFTVGRLDKETSGLIILTNDGHFANQVIHPSSNIEKEYLVKTDAEIADTHLKTISKGTWVEGSFVRPLKVVKVRRGTLKVTVSEGKKREVRYLVEKAGLQALQLKRIRIGGLKLGTLPEGAFRPLTPREKKLLFQNG